MAVMQNSIIFGGVDSADYGIYIGGEGTFNAPKRDVEMISIPGRNGAFALDKGRFENIEVEYSAFNYEENLATFAQQLSDFRNALCSVKGYAVLSDTFHPDEYRMAAYIDGLEIDPISYNTASQFTLRFNCMPQRYLTSGENEITVADGDTITNPTRFDSQPMLEVKGYGTIAFNGYVIELENAVMGEVVLADPATVTSKSYFSIYFNNGQFNNGDTITLNGGSFKWDQYTSGAILSSVSSITHSNSAFSTSYTGTASSANPATTTFQPISFTAGTNSTVTDTMTLTGVRSGATVTLVVKTEISYEYQWITGTSCIKFSTTKTSGTSASLYYQVNSVSHSGARGLSTLSILGNPTYIDCELGNVYMMKNNVPVSLNAYIDIGSDLPKLAPGNNIVSFDDSITELKIIPKWWRV